MADRNTDRNNRQTFYEIVLAGPLDVIHGYLAGLVVGSGEKGPLYFSLDEKITGPRISNRVKEFIHIRPRECHLVAESSMRSLIKKRAKAMTESCGVELVSEQRIRTARFAFEYRAYARRYGREIQDLISGLPQTLKILDHEFEEKFDPDAKGAEGYAPAHDYEICGKGSVVGRIDRVIKARRLLDDHPLVVPDAIMLELA